MSKEPLACINCKYLDGRRWRYMMGSYELDCLKYVESHDIVKGIDYRYRCHEARRMLNLCGPKGYGFEPFVPKASLWRRIIVWLGKI
jgi:hypothetical protein